MPSEQDLKLRYEIGAGSRGTIENERRGLREAHGRGTGKVRVYEALRLTKFTL